MGLCPFHQEKTPSFTVSDNKGFYHCFGCGAHGDIVKFVMETRSLSFYEAVKELAAEAGLALPQLTREEKEKQKKISDIYEIMEMACWFFERQLSSNAGALTREYLVKREVSLEQGVRFRLGFAPESFSALKNHLTGRGIEEQALEAAGLVVRSERGETYDRFRGRLIFPITDVKGKVIAFGGRSLGEQMPKYLNSPETDVFKKGHNLYNLDKVRDLARKLNQVVVVEGYMDVIAMDAAGIRNVVAPLGTALTEQQLVRLWQISSEPIICLDGDEAGKRAMARIAEHYLPLLIPGNSLSFVVLPAGLDPDDAIKSKGADYMRKALAHAVPMSEMIWSMEAGGKRLKTPEQAAALEARLSGLAEIIRDRTVKDYYRRFFKDKLFEHSRLGSGMKGIGRKTGAMRRTRAVEDLVLSEITPVQVNELLMVKYVLERPDLLEDEAILEEFSGYDFTYGKLDKVRLGILEHIALNPGVSGENLLQYLEKKGVNPQIFYGKGKNAAGISLNFMTEREEALAGWRFAVAKRNLLQMKELIEKEHDPEKQHELQRQAKVLEHLFELEKVNFESILRIES